MEERREVWSPEVSGRSKSSQQTAVRYLLEVTLAYVLKEKVEVCKNTWHLASEHIAVARNDVQDLELLKSAFAHQHGCPDVELLLELSDEDVDGYNVPLVAVLHVPDDLRHPLKLLLRPRHPQEVHLRRNQTLRIRTNHEDSGKS